MNPHLPSSTSFRVPNSIVQGLTTSTATKLNRLTAVETMTLLALVSFLDSKDPGKKVRVKLADIMAAMKFEKAYSHTVERQWMNKDGKPRKVKYQTSRISPAQNKAVQDALSILAGLKVSVKRTEKKKKSPTKSTESIFREFGYLFEADGKPVDFYSLPPGYEKQNVGSVERPLWVVYKQSAHRRRRQPCKHICFRLNDKLAEELQGLRGTVQYTLFDRQVFDLFRRLSKEPKAIRLLILILRQTKESFTRVLSEMLGALGYDRTHRKRSINALRETLYQLVNLGVVHEFKIDEEADRLFIHQQKDWYKPSQKEEVFDTTISAF